MSLSYQVDACFISLSERITIGANLCHPSRRPAVPTALYRPGASAELRSYWQATSQPWAPKTARSVWLQRRLLATTVKHQNASSERVKRENGFYVRGDFGHMALPRSEHWVRKSTAPTCISRSTARIGRWFTRPLPKRRYAARDLPVIEEQFKSRRRRRE